MRTLVLPVDPRAPDPDAIGQAAAVLARGGLVAFPTETVYGLGALALDAGAVEGIFAAKGRPADNPIIVHVDSIEAAQQLVLEWPDRARILAERFWPGPLTLVLARQMHGAHRLPDLVTAGGATVGIRVPANDVALALLRKFGRPVAAPSANRSEGLSPTTAEHVLASLDGRIDLLLDGGRCTGGLESTVIDLASPTPRILRPGLVSPDELGAVLAMPELQAESRYMNAAGDAKEVTASDARQLTVSDAPESAHTVSASESREPARSPGQMLRHYAPRTPLAVLADSEAAQRVHQLAAEGRRVGWLAWADSRETVPAGVTIIRMARDAKLYAAQLYAALWQLDAENCDQLIVSLPPAGAAWLAVHDRLRRAATR